MARDRDHVSGAVAHGAENVEVDGRLEGGSALMRLHHLEDQPWIQRSFMVIVCLHDYSLFRHDLGNRPESPSWSRDRQVSRLIREVRVKQESPKKTENKLPIHGRCRPWAQWVRNRHSCARRKDTLKRDAKIQSQVGRHVVVRLAAAGRNHCRRTHHGRDPPRRRISRRLASPCAGECVGCGAGCVAGARASDGM